MTLDSFQFRTKTDKDIQLDKVEVSTLKNELIVHDTDNLLRLNFL